MRFWKLEPTEAEDNPHVVYDCMSLFIVRAESEEQARELAASQHKDEGAECWLNPKWSTCEEFEFPTLDGAEEIVWREDHPG